ncbi:MAG: pantetheine-phosphate adenylyltransferase [Flavobacteriales bacterium]|jgi:pantetheine-phosphate adenylyltransferase
MKRIAVFPGSFDPVTRGHCHVVERACTLFDEVIVALGHNTTKQTMFGLEQRMEWLRASFAHLPAVQVDSYEGLTVDYCRAKGANYVLRGLRNGGDFEYERTIAHMNKALWNELETILIFTDPEFASVHSTIIREIIRNRGDVSPFVPEQISIPV